MTCEPSVTVAPQGRGPACAGRAVKAEPGADAGPVAPQAPRLINPDAGRVLFGRYASDWIEERPGLRPKKVQLYRYLLRSHI